MAIKKPLVISSTGVVQQLQAGDTLQVDTSLSDVRSLTNGEGAAAIVIGTPVYISGAGAMRRAQANALATARVIGLGSDTSVAAAAAGLVVLDGTLSATTAQWDAITGQTGGLTAGAVYFLDPATVGKLTVTCPTTVGQLVTLVGQAFSTTDMEVGIEPPILL